MWLKITQKSKKILCLFERMLRSEPRNQGQNQGLNIFENAFLGLAISDQKIIPRKTEWMEHLVCSGVIPAVPRNRKLSEFRSEPFLGRGNCLEF